MAIALREAVELLSIAARELIDHSPLEDNLLAICQTAIIAAALEKARGNTSRAARMLGMERNSLNYQIGELHLEPLIADVKIAAEKQLTLFSRRKFPRPDHSRRTEFSKACG